MSADDIPPEYQWLRAALAPHCDKVISDRRDYGVALAIGVFWAGPPRMRQAMVVHEVVPILPERDARGRFVAGSPTACLFDLNEEIAAGRDSRERVIAALLARG